MNGLSIRVRLTLWYGGLLAVMLGGFGVAVYWMLGHALMERIDESLEGEFHETEERLEAGVAVENPGGQHDDHHESYLARLTDPAGQIREQSPVLRDVRLPVPQVVAGSAGRTYTSEEVSRGAPHRVLSGKVRTSEGEWLVQLATPLARYDHELAELRTVLLMIVPAGLIAAVAGGYWLAGRALAPVDQITNTARRISAQTLGERIPIANPQDELGRLAETLNAMITRLEQSFDAMRQFTADASHELRTPLTAIRTEAEVALRAARSPEQYERVLASVIEEVERMTKLADNLLLLSREDARATPMMRRPLALDELVRAVAEDMTAVARQAGVTLTIAELAAATIEGDADRLRQVFFNLLDNAINYTPTEGSVTVRGRLGDGWVAVEVADTGIGIPREHLPRIFDRFYRVDKSRSRDLGGVGLGLSISKALVESHQGQIEVESTPGKGSTFRVILPVHEVLTS